MFLGSKWEDAKIVLQLVTLIIPLRVLSMLLGPLLDGLGHPGLGLRNLLTFTATIPLAVFVGTNWGLFGVCVGLLAASCFALAINFHRSLPVINISAGELIGAIAPSAISACAMYAAVIIVGTYVVADATTILRLMIRIATGVTVYTAMTLLFNRDTVLQAIALIRMRT